MFLGRETKRIDDKGRLAVPAKFREQVGAGARLYVVRKVLDPCLEVHPEARFHAFVERLDKLGRARPEVRKFRRQLAAGAEAVSLDRQGRILLSSHLREYAGLEREAVLVGSFDTFEIWDVDRFTTEMDGAVDRDELASTLADLGL